MRTRWIGIAGLLLLLGALALNVVGPRWFHTAYYGRSGSGMMNGGMMSSMMGGGMMDDQAVADPAQPFDRRFLDNMIVHHQQAVMMVQHMIADSERPELRDLGQRIVTAQQREIEQMRRWRSDWYGTAEAATPAEAMMAQMQGGMMDREQMRRMMGGSVDLDRMFLHMMVPHHQEAISMAQQALEQAQHEEITTLAQAIIDTQRTEIAEMQRYLSAWYGASG